MACPMPISQTQSFPTGPTPPLSLLLKSSCVQVLVPRSRESTGLGACRRMNSVRLKAAGVVKATATEMPRKRRSGEEAKGFVEEMRDVAMKLHTRDQSKEGEKEPVGKPVARWEPTVEGYLRFLVDSKAVYDTLEFIVAEDAFPWYAEFRSTGLERSEKLAKDLEWFREEGHAIPEPSTPGLTYSQCLKELSKKDPQAFICHFYNFYFAHTAGGRMIGKKVAEKILNGKELEFYKWEGDLRHLLQNVREKLNQVSNDWSREEKNHCLEETEKSFKYSGEILRFFVSLPRRFLWWVGCSFFAIFSAPLVRPSTSRLRFPLSRCCVGLHFELLRRESLLLMSEFLSHTCITSVSIKYHCLIWVNYSSTRLI